MVFLSIILLYNNFSGDLTGFKNFYTDSIYICPIENEVISSNPLELKYLDSIYYFCCSGCEMLFKKEPARFISSDLKCLPCNDYDARVEHNFIYDGVKYYFCSGLCKGKFVKSPERYLKEN